MQAVKDNIKFTQTNTPKTNTAKTVKAEGTKSNHVQFVEAAKTTTKQNTTFQEMITKTSTQQNLISQKKKKTGSTSKSKSSSTTTKPSTSKPSSTTTRPSISKPSSTTTQPSTSKPSNTTTPSTTTPTDTVTKPNTKIDTTTETDTITKPSISTRPYKPHYPIQFVFPTQMFPPSQTVAPVEGTTEIQETTLEGMLKAKYPNLKYHVFDASSSYWRTRNDYPHYLLYQDEIDTEAIENWKPSGENPFYGSQGGVFMAPKEIKALSSIPAGTTAVVIHPKVQERMENDPEYAKEIYDRINKWFEFDKARNEAIMPGINARSSWCVAIGEDGEIVNAQSHSSGGGFTQSQSGTDAALDFWTQRSLRHKYFMQMQLEGQLRHEMLLYGLTGTAKSSGLFDLAGGVLSTTNLVGLINLLQSSETPMLSSQQMQEKANAKAKLTAMLNSGELNILGDTVAGMPLEKLISLTKQEVSKDLF